MKGMIYATNKSGASFVSNFSFTKLCTANTHNKESLPQTLGFLTNETQWFLWHGTGTSFKKSSSSMQWVSICLLKS